MATNIPLNSIDGDLTIGRNLTVGGNQTIRDNLRVCHNLRVDGWLEARNIKGANKGFFATEPKLRERYPSPEEGWWALVGNGMPARVWIAYDGDWHNTQTTVEAVSVDDGVFQEDLDELKNKVAECLTADDINGLNRDVLTLKAWKEALSAGGKVLTSIELFNGGDTATLHYINLADGKTSNVTGNFLPVVTETEKGLMSAAQAKTLRELKEFKEKGGQAEGPALLDNEKKLPEDTIPTRYLNYIEFAEAKAIPRDKILAAGASGAGWVVYSTETDSFVFRVGPSIDPDADPEEQEELEKEAKYYSVWKEMWQYGKVGGTYGATPYNECLYCNSTTGLLYRGNGGRLEKVGQEMEQTVSQSATMVPSSLAVRNYVKNVIDELTDDELTEHTDRFPTSGAVSKALGNAMKGVERIIYITAEDDASAGYKLSISEELRREIMEIALSADHHVARSQFIFTWRSIAYVCTELKVEGNGTALMLYFDNAAAPNDSSKRGRIAVQIGSTLAGCVVSFTANPLVEQEVSDSTEAVPSSKAVRNFFNTTIKELTDAEVSPDHSNKFPTSQAVALALAKFNPEQELSGSEDKVPSSKAVSEAIKGTIISEVLPKKEQAPSGEAVLAYIKKVLSDENQEAIAKKLFIKLWKDKFSFNRNKYGTPLLNLSDYNKEKDVFLLDDEELSFEDAIRSYDDEIKIDDGTNIGGKNYKGKAKVLAVYVLGEVPKLDWLCAGCANLEIVRLCNYNTTDANKDTQTIGCASTLRVFESCENLREVRGILRLTGDTNIAHFEAVNWMLKLESIKLYGVIKNIPMLFKLSPYVTLDTFQYLVENAANTTPITVTVHADVYAKLTGGEGTSAEWKKVLSDANAKNISFATV